MCLEVKELKASVAEEDIKCYKVLVELLPGCYYTPYQKTRVDVKKIMQTYNNENLDIKRCICLAGEAVDVEKIDKEYRYQINGGFIHTYQNLIDAQNMVDNVFLKCCTDHATHYKYHVFECIIPVGTTYWFGSDTNNLKSYASEKICYKDIVYSKGDFDKDESDETRTFKILTNLLWLSGYLDIELKKVYDTFNLNHTNDCNKFNKEVGAFEIEHVVRLFQDENRLLVDYGITAPGHRVFLWLISKDTGRDKHLAYYIIDYMIGMMSYGLLGYKDFNKIIDILTSEEIIKTIGWDELKDEDTHIFKEHFATPYDYFQFKFSRGSCRMDYQEERVFVMFMHQLLAKI